MGGAALAAPRVCAVWRADAAVRGSLRRAGARPGHLAARQGACAVVGLAHARSRSGGLQRTRALEGLAAQRLGGAPSRAEADGSVEGGAWPSGMPSEAMAERAFQPQRCADFDCQPDRLPHADCLKVGEVGALAYCGLVAARWRDAAPAVEQAGAGGEVAPEVAPLVAPLVALVDLQPLRGGGRLAGPSAQLQVRDACTGEVRAVAPLPSASSGRWLLASDGAGRL